MVFNRTTAEISGTIGQKTGIYVFILRDSATPTRSLPSQKNFNQTKISRRAISVGLSAPALHGRVALGRESRKPPPRRSGTTRFAITADCGNQAVRRSRGPLASRLHMLIDDRGHASATNHDSREAHNSRVCATLLSDPGSLTTVFEAPLALDPAQIRRRPALPSHQPPAQGRVAARRGPAGDAGADAEE